MALEGYSKTQKQQLRDLKNKAYAAELNTQLAELHKDFQDWQQGKLDPFDLSHKIHEFHQGVSRELYKQYEYLDADVAVARALAYDILKDDEVPQALGVLLEKQRKVFAALAEPRRKEG